MSKEEQKTIEILRCENESLGKEIRTLKQKISGYKTSNDNYRQRIAALKERVEHYKQLDLEGDGLYEKKIAELEDANKQHVAEVESLNEKIGVEKAENARLCDLVDTEREKYVRLSADYKALQEKFNEAEILVEEHNSKPWYKRFRKI